MLLLCLSCPWLSSHSSVSYYHKLLSLSVLMTIAMAFTIPAFTILSRISQSFNTYEIVRPPTSYSFSQGKIGNGYRVDSSKCYRNNYHEYIYFTFASPSLCNPSMPVWSHPRTHLFELAYSLTSLRIPICWRLVFNVVAYGPLYIYIIPMFQYGIEDGLSALDILDAGTRWAIISASDLNQNIW